MFPLYFKLLQDVSSFDIVLQRIFWSLLFLIALLVGGIEALGLIADRLQLKGGLWDMGASLSEHFGMLGYGIVAIFAACWLVSALIYKWRGYDSIDRTIAR